jgi:salicylate hydroxylase
VAQAVEDAAAITAVLSMVKCKAELSAALQAYETSRKDRVVEMQEATSDARHFAFRKDKAKDGDKGQEAKRGEEVVKLIRSAWGFDAAEAARTALLAILRRAV